MNHGHERYSIHQLTRVKTAENLPSGRNYDIRLGNALTAQTSLHCFMSNRKSKSYLAFFAQEMEKSIHLTNNILLFRITSAAFAFDRRAGGRQAVKKVFVFHCRLLGEIMTNCVNAEPNTECQIRLKF